ncbi:MAG: hypothetical protein KAS32_27715 [Candidatus Peribacteraceae bacterium]|nr:hypothetical protein [Candidatus Peribacteraceae bacterium]
MNVKSPTGMVHEVETNWEDGSVVVMCHHHYGTCMSFDIDVRWKSTKEPVTCKRCILATSRLKEMSNIKIKHIIEQGLEEGETDVNYKAILLFVEMHNKDIPNAAYKIGETVTFQHPLGNGKGEIIGVADTGDGIEYAVEYIPYLLWESEILGGK